MPTDPLDVLEPIFYGPQAASPELGEEELGIRIALAEATGQFGPTVALFAFLRVRGELGTRYRALLIRATRILAVDQETGQCYQGSAEMHNSVRFQAPRLDSAEETSVRLCSMETHFGVDLAAILKLPPSGGKYSVFLWLDDMVSNVLTVEMPENQAPLSMPPALASELPSPFLEMPGDHSFEIGQAALALGPAIEEKGLAGAELTVAGRIGEGAFGDEESAPSFLTILVRQDSVRSVESYTGAVPDDFVKDCTFMTKPLLIGGTPKPPEHIFVLAVFGDVTSQTITIEPDQIP